MFSISLVTISFMKLVLVAEYTSTVRDPQCELWACLESHPLIGRPGGSLKKAFLHSPFPSPTSGVWDVFIVLSGNPSRNLQPCLDTSQYSVYFFELPRTLSAGYFASLCSIFFLAAALRPVPGGARLHRSQAGDEVAVSAVAWPSWRSACSDRQAGGCGRRSRTR